MGYFDGTFAITPDPYFQSAIVQVHLNGNNYFVGAGLLPNKLTETYRDFIVDWLHIAAEDGYHIEFTRTHSDAELAWVNVLQEQFPEAQHQICGFLVKDAICRNASDLGLRRVIRQSSIFRLFYYRVQNIFHFEKSLWPRLFRLFYSQLSPEIRDDPKVDKWVLYLNKLWIPKSNPVRPKDVKYHPKLTQ